MPNLPAAHSPSQQARELRQMQARAKQLNVLLQHWALGLQDGAHNAEAISHFAKLMQQHLDAVLLYQDVARHWSAGNQRRAKKIISTVLSSQRQLAAVLRNQRDWLGQKIDQLQLRSKVPSYNSIYKGGRAIGRAFDLHG